MPIETLFEQYGVDRDHARHVADMSLILFDQLPAIHGVPDSARHLLEMGALLHNVGLNVNERLHHIAGRDIVLHANIDGLEANERTLVACLVAFHRKKVRPQQEPAFLSLKSKDQDIALRLSALLRVADGLDYSQSQSTRIDACKIDEKGVCLALVGPEAFEDGERAVKKADLWRKVFGAQLTIEYVAPDAAEEVALPRPELDGSAVGQVVQGVEEQAPAPHGQPLMSSEDALAEAGRRLLRRQFQKLLAREQDVRADTEIEAVHQMRVATRRLRAALAILNQVAPRKQVRHFQREIRRLARSSSMVRDCDVFLEQVAHYTEQLPADQRAGLEPLVTALQRERRAAYTQLRARLDSRRYTNFKRDFALFMTEEPEGWDMRLRIRDIVGSSIWRRYEALRAYEVVLNGTTISQQHDETLHEIRITGKRLRYMLEMFAEVLDSGVDQVVDQLKRLQDHLGTLQDIAVARAYVVALDVPDAAQPVLDAYVASREAERIQLLDELPQLWEKLMQATYRRKLMSLIVKL